MVKPEFPSDTLASLMEIVGTAITLTVTVAVSVPPFPSEIVYSNVATPVNPEDGTKTASPFTNETVPFVGFATPIIVSVFPSGSVSLGVTS